MTKKPRRAGDFNGAPEEKFDHDGDGKPGGSLPKGAGDEPEGEPVETGDPPADPPPSAEAEPEPDAEDEHEDEALGDEPPPADVNDREVEEFTLSDDGVLAIGPDFRRDYEQLADRLLMVSIVVTDEQLQDLTDEQFQQASLYAVAAYAAASDNPVQVPDRPDFLPEPTDLNATRNPITGAPLEGDAQASTAPEPAPRFLVVDGRMTANPDGWRLDPETTQVWLEELGYPKTLEELQALPVEVACDLDVWAFAYHRIALGDEDLQKPEASTEVRAFLELPEPAPADPTAQLDAEFAGVKGPDDGPAANGAGVQPFNHAQAVALLGELVASRHGLYLHPNQAAYGPPEGRGLYPEALVAGAVAEELAYYEPTGGAHGSVKITDKGRAAYKAIRQAEPSLP